MRVTLLHTAATAVGYYRMWMPAKWLSRSGWHVTAYPRWQTVDRSLALQPPDCNILQDVAQADVTVFQWFAIPQILQIAQQLRQITHTPLLLEMDDDVLNVPPEHAAYEVYRAHTEEEMFETIGLPLEAAEIYQRRGWQVRMVPGGLEARRFRWMPFQEPFKQVLGAMDGLTVTTPYLGETYGPMVDRENTHVLPNCFDPDDWEGIEPAPRTEYPSILWAGSMAHNGNLEMVRPALERVLEAIPTVKFLVMGDVNLPVFKKLPQDRLVNLGWSRLEDYHKALADCGAWVGIAPAQDNPFTRAKSHIRWMEYGLAGIPAICSPTPEYLTCAKDGARFADTTEQWEAHLRQLLESASLRADLTAAARVRVAECDIRQHIHKWMDAYTAAVVKGPKRQVEALA